MTSTTQEFEVVISFKYEADVFEEDPTDVYELAEVEALDMRPRVEGMLQSYIGDVDGLTIKLEPVL